jgi:hypothetical protein
LPSLEIIAHVGRALGFGAADQLEPVVVLGGAVQPSPDPVASHDLEHVILLKEADSIMGRLSCLFAGCAIKGLRIGPLGLRAAASDN